MVTTPNLEITHIEQSQSQKEVTANEAFDILDKGTQGTLSVSTATLGSPAEVNLTNDQFQQNYMFVLSSDASETFTLNVPAKTHLFAVENQSDYTCTVELVGTTSRVEVPAGSTVIIHSKATALTQMSNFYDIAFYFQGVPSDAAVLGFVCPRKTTLGINAIGSRARNRVASDTTEPTHQFSIRKNNSQIGTVDFAAGDRNGTFVIAAATSFDQDDLLEIVNPTFGSPTTIISGISIVLKAGTKVDN